jgi:hypothetical protein
MRAILIDPDEKTVTEIQRADSYHEINRVLQCKSHTTGAHLSGTLEEGFDAILVSDDEFDEEKDDPRFWFQLDADHNPPSSFPMPAMA